MKPHVLALTLGLLATSIAPAQAQGRKPAREGWLGDYEVARKLARATDKPMLVVFRCEP
jgi:hypothetical protein